MKRSFMSQPIKQVTVFEYCSSTDTIMGHLLYMQTTCSTLTLLSEIGQCPEYSGYVCLSQLVTMTWSTRLKNDVAKLGQHTVSIIQSKVHLIWKCPVIEKGLFWGWPATGGADSGIVRRRSLRPAWFGVDKREQSGGSEEIPFIRLTSR